MTDRTNKVYVVGTLLEVNSRKASKDGKNYIGGSFTVQVNNLADASRKNVIEFKFFAYELTQKGAKNTRYTNYADLETMINHRVKVSGELSGRAFYQATQGQVIPFNEINASFINLAKDTEKDAATFEFLGFVVGPLTERLNDKEEVVSYDLKLGQMNYNGDAMQVINFTVDKSQTKMVSGMQDRYVKGATVYITGSIFYIPVQTTRTTEVDFGDSLVKVINSMKKMFLVSGAKAPLIEEGTFYTVEEIAKLEAAYQNYLAEVERNAKADAKDGKMVSNEAPAKTANFNSLLL